LDPTAQGLLDALGAAAALPRDAGDERRRGTEAVREQLSSWSCLTTELHDRLHRALPPVSPP
jgi:hypothetical protein